MIEPSPSLLPTSRSPPNFPQLAGARASPQDVSRWPAPLVPAGSTTRSLMNLPSVVNSATPPPNGLFGFAYVTKSVPLMFWTSNAVNPGKLAARLGFTSDPTDPHLLLNTKTLLLFWSAA